MFWQWTLGGIAIAAAISLLLAYQSTKKMGALWREGLLFSEEDSRVVFLWASAESLLCYRHPRRIESYLSWLWLLGTAYLACTTLPWYAAVITALLAGWVFNAAANLSGQAGYWAAKVHLTPAMRLARLRLLEINSRYTGETAALPQEGPARDAPTLQELYPLPEAELSALSKLFG